MKASLVPTRVSRNLIVVKTEETYFRYFNGRKFYVNRELEHYVYPGNPAGGFSIHIIFTCIPNARRHLRYTSTSITPRF